MYEIPGLCKQPLYGTRPRSSVPKIVVIKTKLVLPHAVEKESLETCTDEIIPSQEPSITWQIMATKTWHMTLNANFSQILETYVSIMSSIKQNAEAFTDKRPLLQIQRYTVTVKLTSTCHRPWPIACHSQKWPPNIIQPFFLCLRFKCLLAAIALYAH